MPASTANAGTATVVTGTWTGAANATGANNATFAQWAETIANGTASLDLSNLGTWSSIPAGSTINSVTVTVWHYVSNTTRMLASQAQGYLGSTALGTATTLTLSTTTTTSDTFTITGLTLAQLQGNTLKVRFTGRRANNTQAANANVDAVSVAVDYSVPNVVDVAYARFQIGAANAAAPVSGTAVSTLPTFGQAAAGTHTAPAGTFNGNATSPLPTLTQAASGTHTAPAGQVNVAYASFSIGPAAPATAASGLPRPVVNGQGVQLDVVTNSTSHSWTIISGGGSLTNATTATPTYTAPATGTGTAVVRDTLDGGTTADVTVGYGPNIVAAENTLTGTARATWDLPTTDLGGINTLQGFADGFSFNKTETVNFKIAQSDTAGWSAHVYRLGYYGDTGARSYGTLTPTAAQVTSSQAQPAGTNVEPAITSKVSRDCGNWSVTLTWTPPSWAPSGIYVLRLNRTGGGASQILFLLRDDARTVDLTVMPSDSTWNAYNAFGTMGTGWLGGNSVYYGTSIDQYHADCAHYVSYNRPMVNRAAVHGGYGAVNWSTFFTGEFPMVRFLERNGYDLKYLACIDAAGDPTGTKLVGKTKTAMYVGHNEYWSNNMRACYEAAKAAGVNLFACAGNDVFWRLVGANNDTAGRPRTWECWKSTINGRGNTQPEWTGTWRDPDGAGKGGNNPENLLTPSIFMVNGPDLRSLVVPTTGGYREQPIWRNTTVATGSYTSPSQILGFEWNVPGQGFVDGTGAQYTAVPHAQIRYCSTVTYAISSGLLLTDAGDVYNAAGNATHRLAVIPNGANGGISFATGTINWALGVDNSNTYQVGADNVSLPIQQATINMLRDMLAAPATPMAGITVSDPVVWFFTATATSVLPAFGQAAAGTATTSAVTGTAASPLPTLGQAAAGTVTAPVSTGTATSGLATLTQAVAGTATAPAFTGTAGNALPTVGQAATGTVTAPVFTGTATSGLASLTQAAAGTATVPAGTGTATSNLPTVGQSATGTHTAPAFTGTALSPLPAFGQAAAGTSSAPASRTGTAASNLPTFEQAAVGTLTRKATAESTLALLTQAAAGTVSAPPVTGTATSVLPTFVSGSSPFQPWMRWRATSTRIPGAGHTSTGIPAAVAGTTDMALATATSTGVSTAVHRTQTIVGAVATSTDMALATATTTDMALATATTTPAP